MAAEVLSSLASRYCRNETEVLSTSTKSTCTGTKQSGLGTEGIDIIALLSSTNCIFNSFAEASSISPSSTREFATDYFDDLYQLHKKHLHRLIEWEKEGCEVYDGLSSARAAEWSSTCKALKLLRFATKLSNEVFSILQCDESQDSGILESYSMHVNAFAGLFELLRLRQEGPGAEAGATVGVEAVAGESSDSSNNPIKSNSLPFISVNHLMCIWISSLLSFRNKSTGTRKDSSDFIHFCLFASLDNAWLGYKSRNATCEKVDGDKWIELSIDSNGKEYILNPVKGKFEDLTGLIEFQNNILTVSSSTIITSTSLLADSRPPALTFEYFTSIHIPQLVILSCLLPLSPLGSNLLAYKDLLDDLSSIQKSIVSGFGNSSPDASDNNIESSLSLQSSLSAFIEAKLEHLNNRNMFNPKSESAQHEALAPVIEHYRSSVALQPQNYVCKYELGRCLYMNSFMHLSEAVDQFDKLITHFKYLEEVASEIDGNSSLPVLAQIVSLKSAALMEAIDVEGSFSPQDRIEVLWTTHNEDGSVVDVFYPGTIEFDFATNGLVLKYDDNNDGIIYRVECIDDQSLLNLNEDCEMTWRYAANTGGDDATGDVEDGVALESNVYENTGHDAPPPTAATPSTSTNDDNNKNYYNCSNDSGINNSDNNNSDNSNNNNNNDKSSSSSSSSSSNTNNNNDDGDDVDASVNNADASKRRRFD